MCIYIYIYTIHIISATAPCAYGVPQPLPVRVTSFLPELLYLLTFLPLKGPEILPRSGPPPLGHLQISQKQRTPPKPSKTIPELPGSATEPPEIARKRPGDAQKVSEPGFCKFLRANMGSCWHPT